MSTVAKLYILSQSALKASMLNGRSLPGLTISLGTGKGLNMSSTMKQQLASQPFPA